MYHFQYAERSNPGGLDAERPCCWRCCHERFTRHHLARQYCERRFSPGMFVISPQLVMISGHFGTIYWTIVWTKCGISKLHQHGWLLEASCTGLCGPYFLSWISRIHHQTDRQVFKEHWIWHYQWSIVISQNFQVSSPMDLFSLGVVIKNLAVEM